MRLWFQHHMVASKLAQCNEQLLLLKLQAANALHLFSHQERFGQYWALTAERLAQLLRQEFMRQAAVAEGHQIPIAAKAGIQAVPA